MNENPTPPAGDIVRQSSPDVISRPRIVPLRFYLWLLIAAWTAAIAGSLAWNLVQRAQEVKALARQTADALLEKDLLYREWNTSHGGVYVPVAPGTTPNPYLKVPERDVTTNTGKALTLMNPAYMTRQVFELQNRKMRIQGHITSLKPIRPENKPDEWESRALREFEKGLDAKDSVEVMQGEEVLRLMRPLPVTDGCLRCHAEQGYKVGDIRGGISVAVPLGSFSLTSARRYLWLGHSSLWLLGLGMLCLGWRKLHRQERAREKVEADREHLIEELHGALARITTLKGLLPICAACKNIRDDTGYWHSVEAYVAKYSDATFTHGICPECLHKLYPEHYRKGVPESPDQS